MTRRAERPVRFSHHMVQEVRDCVRAGYASNADIAEQLAAVFDPRITAEDVARWRREYPRFNVACGNSLRQSNIMMAAKEYELAMAGDASMVKHWNDRRNPAFMPKSRMDMRGGSSLDAMLKERLDEDDLRDDGTITDGDDDDR